MSSLIILGSGAVFVAALLGGLTGFGFSLLVTPLLLLLGLSSATAVAISLAIALFTRVVVVFRLRRFVRLRRAVPLTVASIPGLVVGAAVGGTVSPRMVHIATGLLVTLVAPLLLLMRPGTGDKPPSRYVLSGFAGGLLATTTSMNGVPAALMLSAEDADQRSFIADLAVYFVLSNIVGLSVLTIRDGVHLSIVELCAWWLPGALVANWAGTALAPRIRPKVFRVITCVLIMMTGIATLVTA